MKDGFAGRRPERGYPHIGWLPVRRGRGGHLSKRCKSSDFKRMGVWTCR